MRVVVVLLEINQIVYKSVKIKILTDGFTLQIQITIKRQKQIQGSSWFIHVTVIKLTVKVKRKAKKRKTYVLFIFQT